MEADISNQTRFYRRGMVIGLSMAEIVTLLLFVLLLALAALLRAKDKQIATLEHTTQTQEAHIAALDAKMNGKDKQIATLEHTTQTQGADIAALVEKINSLVS